MKSIRELRKHWYALFGPKHTHKGMFDHPGATHRHVRSRQHSHPGINLGNVWWGPGAELLMSKGRTTLK